MRDINSPLQKVYHDTLNGALINSAGVEVGVYEDQAPDTLPDGTPFDPAEYVVITGRTSFDTSTKTSTDVSAQIQVSVHTRKRKYNNRKELNLVCGQILQRIKPTPNAVLDMSAFDIQMMNLSLDNDVEQDYGTLADQAFVSRNLIFQQDLFIK